MKIIRDEELFGLAMIPLFVDRHIKRCNVKDCTEKPTTIVTQLALDIPVCGFCEKHYQEANKGGTTFTFVFDGFDAFEKMDE